MRTMLASIALASLTLTGCGGRPLVSVREYADYYAGQKDYAKALSEYREYLGRMPEDTQVRYRYAATLAEAGEASEAREQFAILVDVNPLDDRFIDGYTRSLYTAGANEELAQFLNRMVTQRASVTDHLRLGEYLQKMGDVDGAKTAYQEAARADGGASTRPWIAQADLYHSIGDKKNEIAAVQRALYVEPNSPILAERLRSLGGIPGPSAGIRPDEVIEPASR